MSLESGSACKTKGVRAESCHVSQVSDLVTATPFDAQRTLSQTMHGLRALFVGSSMHPTRPARLLSAACMRPTRRIFADIENCFDDNKSSKWLIKACKDVAELRTYAAWGKHRQAIWERQGSVGGCVGGHVGFVSVLVDPGRNAADKALVACLGKVLEGQAAPADVLVLTKDKGLIKAASQHARKTASMRFAHCKEDVWKWLMS